MRRFWGWLGLNLGKRSGTVAIVGLLITVAFGFGVTTLRFTTTNADYLNPKDPAWLANVAYDKVFGGDPMLTMITMNKGKTVADLYTPANQREFTKIGNALQHDHWVFSDVTPLDAMGLSQVLLSVPPGGTVLDSPGAKILEYANRADTNPTSQAKRGKYLLAEGDIISGFSQDQQKLSNPAWVRCLMHEPTDYSKTTCNGPVRTAVSAFVPNDTHALLAIVLDGNLTINQEAAAAQSVTNILKGAQFQNAHILTTGVPELLKTINDYLKHGILVLAFVACVLMITILWLAFNVRWRFLAFAVVAVGTIWGFGLVGFFGIPLTLATIAALPVLLGVGMDYAIQMHSRIEEEVVLDRAAHPVQAAARGLGPALLVVTFDAVFSFMALWFAKTPAIREFGSLLVVGIVAVCVCSIVATLAVLGIREYKSPTKGKDFSKGRMSRLVVFLGSVPKKFATPFAIAAIAIFLTGIAVEGHIHISTDAISWVDPHSKAIEDIKAVKAGTGAANEIAVNVETTHPFSNQTIDFVSKISRQLNSQYKGVLLPAAGLVSTLDQVMNAVPGTKHVDPTGSQIEGLYLLAPPGIRRTTMADNGRAINIIFRAYPDTLSSLEPVVKELQTGMGAPPGITVAPGGIAIVGVGLIENLEKSRVLLTYLAVLFVGAFLAVRLRSIIRSLLSLVPVLVAVGSVAIIAFAFRIKLSPVTAVTGPLVVAVCTEFTSLILLRFVEERERGHSPREAMDATARRTGRAFLVSAMTAIAGIGTLAASTFPLLRDFGIIVALNVSVALLAALVVLPPLLVAAEERGWVTRGLLGKKEVPFIEFEPAVVGGPPPGAFTEPEAEPVPVGVGVAAAPTTNGGWPDPVLQPAPNGGWPEPAWPPPVVEPPVVEPVAQHSNGDGHEPAWQPQLNGEQPAPAVESVASAEAPAAMAPPPPPLLADLPIEPWQQHADGVDAPPPPLEPIAYQPAPPPPLTPAFPEPVAIEVPPPLPPPPPEPVEPVAYQPAPPPPLTPVFPEPVAVEVPPPPPPEPVAAPEPVAYLSADPEPVAAAEPVAVPEAEPAAEAEPVAAADVPSVADTDTQQVPVYQSPYPPPVATARPRVRAGRLAALASRLVGLDDR